MGELRTLGKYEVRGTLGRGAMGTVLDGWDPRIGRRVAIKTVQLPADPDPETLEAIERFKREAQAAGKLTHPNIVGVYDQDEAGDIVYIVMEFVDGPSLKSLLDRGERMEIATIVEVMEQLLAGLQFSHSRGVIHRDIKPANIMLTSDRQVKIADFGIARIEQSSLTQAGTMMGTPAYMSPEQFMGQPVDARTDVYSAGIVLYQLLTGERPFEGAGLTAIMHKALHTEPAPPSSLSVTAPPALDSVVLRAIAKRPDARFPSAAAFAQAIRAALAGPEAADAEGTVVRPRVGTTLPSLPAPPVPPPPRSRAPLLAGVAMVVLLALAGGAWWLFGQANPPTPQVVATKPMPPAPVETKPTPSAPVETKLTPPAPAETKLTPPVPVETKPTPPEPAETKLTPPTPAETMPTPPVPAEANPTSPAPVMVTAAEAAAALRRDIAAVLPQAHCALATADVPDTGTVTLSGISGDPEALRATVAALTAATGRDVQWRGETVRPALCRALEILSPITLRPSPEALTLDLGSRTGTALREDELIQPHIVMPEFPAWLRLDYVSSDGTLAHFFPTLAETGQGGRRIAAQPPRKLGQHEAVTLGRPGKDKSGAEQPAWPVGEPFGTDMMIAIASSAPLKLSNTANYEDAKGAAAYLDRLAREIDALRGSKEKVVGAILLVNTTKK